MPQAPLGGTLFAAGGLTDINWTLNISTLVLFGIFAFVLAKFAWKPLLDMIEEREKSVRDAVDGAGMANAEARALLERHKELIREAARERDELMKRAMKEADQLKAELSSRARAESEQIVQKAREQIGREKALAVQELRAQVADIAVEAAAKIVTSSLTPQVQRKLVADFIAELPKAR